MSFSPSSETAWADMSSEPRDGASLRRVSTTCFQVRCSSEGLVMAGLAGAWTGSAADGVGAGAGAGCATGRGAGVGAGWAAGCGAGAGAGAETDCGAGAGAGDGAG